MNNKIILSTVGVVFAVVLGMFFLQKTEVSQTDGGYSNDALSEFATCIADSGAKFYGAFWCSHCQNQKKAFKEAASLLPYVECSTADGKSQTAVCRDAGITSYPTWVFADGTSMTGEVPFAGLSEGTGCVAPIENVL